MQNTITQYGAPGFAGMLDGIGTKNVRSYAAEEALPMGFPVKLGTNAEKQVLKATAGAGVIGFTIHDQARNQNVDGAVQYLATETASILTQGRIWVKTSDTVVAGATANLTVADGSLTDAPVASGIEAFTQINVKFITGTTGAGLAIVEAK